MIINSLLNLIYGLFSIILSPLDIPGFDPEAYNSFSEMLTLLDQSAASVLGLLVPRLAFNLVRIIIVVEVGLHVYDLFLYFVKKIPFLNVN